LLNFICSFSSRKNTDNDTNRIDKSSTAPAPYVKIQKTIIWLYSTVDKPSLPRLNVSHLVNCYVCHCHIEQGNQRLWTWRQTRHGRLHHAARWRCGGLRDWPAAFHRRRW